MGFDAVIDVEVAGRRVSYRTLGDPTAPPMVLLHAFGTNSEDWAPVAEAFAATHWIIAPDARGQGASEWADNYSLESFRDDVLGLLSAFALADVVLIGHSMGGIVAALVAETRPASVRLLVIEDVSIPTPNDPPVERRPGAGARPGVDPALGASIGAQLAGPNADWWLRAVDITVPTLVLAGGPDSHQNQESIAAMAIRIPDSTLLTIPAGHRIHTTMPHEFNSAVRDFLTTQSELWE